MEQRKGSLDTVPASRDAVFEDDVYIQPHQKQNVEQNSKFQKIQQDTIVEQADEFTETKLVEPTQEEKDQLKIKEMLQMMDKLEQKYKSVEKQYVQDRESVKIEIQIDKQLQKVEQLQKDLEDTIESEKENIQNADISEDYKLGKDALLLNVISQLQVIQTKANAQQKLVIEKEEEEKRKKDERIQELELMIQKLKEENQNIQAQSLSYSKFEPQQEEISPQQIQKKQNTEGGSKEIWLPQNEMSSNDFTYFSSTTANNKLKLKPIQKSTIPHYEYIPPAKTNILQSSLNRELYKVAQSNRNVFLQAIKVDATQRHNTPLTKSSEKYKQVFNTPHSEPAIGNKYRIKKLQLPSNQSQKNIFSNHLSTESLLFSRNGNFVHNYNAITHNNQNQSAKKPSLQHIRDMNDYFFEKPNTQQNKNY